MAVIKSTASKPTFAGTSLHDLGDLRRNAEEALARARAEADRLVADAKREVERIYSESRESGFEQGKEEGYAVGLAEGRAAGEVAGREQSRTTHEVMIKALEESFGAEFMRWIGIREELLRHAERELAGIAIAIAESIVREHIRAEPKAVLRQVEQAVALFARATRVSIEVAPEDEALVRESLPSLCAALPPEADVAVRARAGIARGGCYIRSSEGTVDARIETLFRRMREGIVGAGEPAPAPEAAAAPASAAASATTTDHAVPSAEAEDPARPSDDPEPPAAAEDGVAP
jgi:flagellar assembly protein FliH